MAKYVIIGNSTAAIGCVEGIRSKDKDGEIVLIASENHHTYARPLISYLLQGKTDEERMKYRPDSFYEENHVTAKLGETVTKLDPEKKTVTLKSGEEIPYEKLLVATGSTPFVPPMEGLDTVPEKFTFMSLDDAHALESVLTKDSRVLIIGAGLIGLKCAEGIKERVKSITVVDLADCVLPSILDETGSAIVKDFLEKQDIPGIAGIDTRALTKILREKGTMNGMITTNENYDLDEILPKLKEYVVGDVVSEVTCDKSYILEGDGPKVALMDFGAKNNIARSLNKRGCEVTIYPAHTSAQEIIDSKPDGIMLSNGPGDPETCVSIIKEVKKLYDSDIPIFAICLGHQLMALANGGKTYKLKYGHRGGNHPVKDLSNNRVYISSQNHGYAVDASTLDSSIATEAFVNVNDGTNEGLSYVGKNIFTVQFHPEACPGPQDSGYLFDRFMDMMKEVQ